MAMRRMWVSLLASLVVCGMAAAQDPKNGPVTVHIESQPVRAALQQFGEQTGLQVLMRLQGEAANDFNVPAVSGQLTASEALDRLLANSGLKYEFINDRTVRISPAHGGIQTITSVRDGKDIEGMTLARNMGQSTSTASTPKTSEGGAGADEVTPSGRDATRDSSKSPQEVLVTGSRVRGAQPSSPLITIGQEDMRLAGHNNLGEVIRALPQNFPGGQNPGVLVGGSSGLTNQNITGGSSLNLRGLGPDATLTLLNGARLPYDGFFQATDVSIVPTAAIDRIEVLLDGASAIYGSDAVGGVANIILKRDFQGVQVSARYGTTTDDGYTQNQYTAVGGMTWGSGSFLLTYDNARNKPLWAYQRDYLDYMTQPNFVQLQPEIEQEGVLFSGHQVLAGGAVEFGLDAYYMDRSQIASFFIPPTRVFNAPDSLVRGVVPSLKFGLRGDWSARVQGFLGSNEAVTDQTYFLATTGAQTDWLGYRYLNDVQGIGVETEGPLLNLPGGQVRTSVGIGYRKNEYERVDRITNLATSRGDRESRYGFLEVNVPLVSEAQGVRGVHYLNFNGAVRYEDYGSDDFGSVATPKAGVVWGIVPALDIKMGWSRSFKAPTLSDQFTPTTLVLTRASSVGATGFPATATVLGLTGGGNKLNPERARILTAGIAFHPSSVPGLNLELGWFKIDYTERVVRPITNLPQAFSNPVFAPFVSLNPTLAEQNARFAMANFFSNSAGAPYDPANVVAFYDNRYTNVTNQKAEGMDVSLRYGMDFGGGRLALSGSGVWLNSEQKLTPLSPFIPTAGVVYFPAEFRGRGGASWSRGGFSLSSYLNFIDAVKDNRSATALEGSSMTTLDLTFDYRMQTARLGDLGLTFAVTNVLNEEPPFIPASAPFFVNFDSTNYSGIGRMVSATATVRF